MRLHAEDSRKNVVILKPAFRGRRISTWWPCSIFNVEILRVAKSVTLRMTTSAKHE